MSIDTWRYFAGCCDKVRGVSIDTWLYGLHDLIMYVGIIGGTSECQDARGDTLLVGLTTHEIKRCLNILCWLDNLCDVCKYCTRIDCWYTWKFTDSRLYILAG
jgi:hypothetical protein